MQGPLALFHPEVLKRIFLVVIVLALLLSIAERLVFPLWPEGQAFAEDYLEMIPGEGDLRAKVEWGVLGCIGVSGLLRVASRALDRIRKEHLNRKIAASSVVLNLRPRADTSDKWKDAADMWHRMRPAMEGSHLHAAIEAVHQADHGISFYLWCPQDVAEALSYQISAQYPGVQIETLEMDYLPPDGHWTWVEMGLLRESFYPINSDHAVDPIGSILAAMETLSRGTEIVGLQVIFRPVRQGKLARVAGLAIARIQGVAPSRLTGLPDAKATTRKLSARERETMRAIESKKDAFGYDVGVRIFASGDGGAQQDVKKLIQAMGQYAGFNRFGVRRKGSDRGTVAMRPFPVGKGLRRRQENLLNLDEMAALMHLPGQSVDCPPLRRAGARHLVPSPEAVLKPEEEGHARVLGRYTRADGTELRVGLGGKDRFRHAYYVGPTGVGKTTLILNNMVSDMNEGTAVVCLEPHEDLTYDVIRRVPPEREGDVILFDVMDEERAIGLNLLEKAGRPHSQVVADVMGVFQKVMGANWESAVRMQRILRHATTALLEAEENPGMFHLLRLLTDPDYRDMITQQVQDVIARDFWLNEVAGWSERATSDAFGPPITRIERFLANEVARRIIAQPRSTIHFRRAMDTNKILLAVMSDAMGADNRVLVGALLVQRIFGAAMSRADTPERQRQETFMYIDEFQTFVADSGEAVEGILAQARKMKLGLTMANQYFTQLPPGVQDAIIGNCGTKVFYRMELVDAKRFRDIFPELTLTDLQGLENFHCYVRLMKRGTPQRVCTLRTYPPPDGVMEMGWPRGVPKPSKPDSRGLELVKQVQGTRDHQEKVHFLVDLSEQDWKLYREARRAYDQALRARILSHPDRIPDKVERIKTLSRLGYGTPHYEVDAEIQRLVQLTGISVPETEAVETVTVELW